MDVDTKELSAAEFISLKGKIRKQSTKPSQHLDTLNKEAVKNLQSDRQLKEKYAQWFIKILMVQLAVMNLIILLAGFKWVAYDTWMLQLYMGGTLAEVFGIVLVITTNLFPKNPSV